jgi:hypothetical protein
MHLFKEFIAFNIINFALKHGKRDKATIMYNTSLPVIFGVKKYAAELMEIVKKRF